MFKLFSPRAVAGAFASLTFLGASPALAASPVTFVSGKGADSGICSLAKPCRSFQFAFGQTSPGGEIKALDPAPYGPVTITHSISITGVEGDGINRPSGDHITIDAGPNDTINLSHLILDGGKAAAVGIQLNSGGSLTISDCVVRNFTATGILLRPAGAAKFLIRDTLVSNNAGGLAIFVVPQAAGSAAGTLNHVSANKNFSGIVLDGFSGPAEVTAVDSLATDNFGSGFASQGSKAVLRLAHSAATRNDNGVAIGTGSKVESFGNNFILGNSTNDIQGTLTPVATQ